MNSTVIPTSQITHHNNTSYQRGGSNGRRRRIISSQPTQRGSVLGEDISESANSGWKDRLKECGVILDYKSELAELVVNGEIALNDAYEQADWIRNEEKRQREEEEAEERHNAQIIEDLTEAGAQNYLDLIEDGSLTPRQAWAAHLDDTRKEREREDLLRRGRSDLYSGMAKALSTLAGYGGYDDIEILMAEYNPDELKPIQLAEFFELENLKLVEHYITAVIEWRKNA